MEVEDGMSPLYDQNASFIKKYDDIDGKNYTVFSVTSNNGLIINMLMEEELNKGFSYKRMAFIILTKKLNDNQISCFIKCTNFINKNSK